AGAIAVRIESHLVAGSALVGHDELRKIARYAQAIGFHLFHCPGPAIPCFRLKQSQRQGRRLDLRLVLLLTCGFLLLWIDGWNGRTRASAWVRLSYSPAGMDRRRSAAALPWIECLWVKGFVGKTLWRHLDTQWHQE